MKSLVSLILEEGTPTVRVEVEGMSRSLIVGTGSNVSILQPGMSRRDVSVTTTKPYGVAVEVLDIKGLKSVTFHAERTRIHPRVPSMRPSRRRSRSAWHRYL